MIQLLPLLTKLPWLASAVSFIKNKNRLLIEYALIALLVTVSGFTLTLWLSKERAENSLITTQAELGEVARRLGIVEFINVQQEATIASLKELRVLDAQVLTGLFKDYRSLVANDARARERLENLEQSNETVRQYLDYIIPPELACLLNATCETGDGDKNGEGDSASGGSAVLPAGGDSQTGTEP